MGKTSTPEPINISADGGYECKLGHYCPLGSYDMTPCPVGTYAKYMGLKSVDDCIKCKINFYQDEPGQKGCKKCGPTATSNGGATGCQCLGLGRNFRKSIGACTCGQGFKPKNDQPNIDSAEDCEAIVRNVCTADQLQTIDGNCITSEEDEERYCNRYCSGGGSIVPGTGMCECDAINMPEESCDAQCQKTRVKTYTTQEGMLVVNNGETESAIDPSTLPGYYGEFKTQSEAGVSQSNAVFMDVGDNFSFDYSVNDDILEAAGVQDNTDRT